jgi:uncharacterized membrane protein YebE (DUF533 family)
MKKIATLLSLLTFLGVLGAQAQSTPIVDERQENQRDRIKQGVVSGELTRKEAAEAREDQRKVRRSERRAKADGEVTAKERARIHRKQNQASRELRRNKHDGQDRPKAKD